MSHSKQQATQKHSNQYPLIKSNHMQKLKNEQRLKQVYKSTSVKQKQKSKHNKNNGRKYYLPLPEKKNIVVIQNNQLSRNDYLVNDGSNNKVTSNNKAGNRYKEYLQGEQVERHYFMHQQHQQHFLNQRYQLKTTRVYGHSQEVRKIDVSSNLQIKTNFRRKITSHLEQNQSFTSRKRQSAQILQNQLHQLNQNLGKKNTNKNASRFLGVEENKNAEKRYHGVNSSYRETEYQKQAFKIRRSTNAKKSFSGSLSKKPSQDHIRQDQRLQNVNNNNANNVNSNNVNSNKMSSNPKKSPIPTSKTPLPTPPKNPFLQQGKKHFKSGNYPQAIKSFQKGKQQQPKNLQFNYNIALVYLKSHKYQQGLGILQEIIQCNPQFKKTVYLFAVISLRHLNLLQKAIEMANKGLAVLGSSNGNGFVDLIFYRGKLYKQIGQYENSLKDMQTVLTLQKDHIQASYYSAYLYFHQTLITHAMSALSAAIYYDQNKHSEMRIQALKLRAKIYLSQNKVKQAKRDLQKVIEKSGHTAETYYLMGKVLMAENNVSEGLICFEKCMREKQKSKGNSTINKNTLSNDTTRPSPLFTSINQNYLIPSLLQICKTKIDMKDFYSAYHHINRYKHFQSMINQNDLSLLRFKYFIQGVVFLMKRKIDEGMRNFQRFIEVQNRLREKLATMMMSHVNVNNVNKSQQQSSQQFNPCSIFQRSELTKQLNYFYPSFYLYRGFGHFMQNNHHLAIKDYEQYEKSKSLDKYMLYNLLLARGVDKINTRQFDMAIGYFNQAGGLFTSTKGDSNNNNSNGNKKVQPYIYRAIAAIESTRRYHHIQKKKDTQKNNDHYNNNDDNDNDQIKILELIFDALKQLDKAYDINDSNSNLLFIRSLIYAYLNKYEESLQDIIKGISKSQENVPKYFFFRGLIHGTMGNKKQAMNDFNIAVNLDVNYAPVYFQRAKLSFQLENYSKAFQDLAKYSELRPQQDEQYHKSALYLVNGLYPMAEQSSQLVKNKQSQQYKQLKFYILLKLGKLQQALQLLNNSNNNEQFQTDRILLQIIINNKIGKNINNKIDKNINNKNNNQQQQQQNILTMQKTPQQSKLKYFNAIQYYHLLGIEYFNSGKYQQALEEFTIALKQCNLRDMQNGVSNINIYINNGNMKRSSPHNSQPEQNPHTILGDKDSNCIVYNIFLCHLKMNDLRKAYEVFIKQIMPIDEKLQKSQFMANFSHLLFQAMKKRSNIVVVGNDNNKSNVNVYNNNSNNNNNQQSITAQDRQQAHVQLFTNIITDQYSKQILLQMSTFSLRTKLSLLNIQCERLHKQYEGKLYPQYVLQWLNVGEVENRPQPPWVKRLMMNNGNNNDQGLVFTDHVLGDIQIEFQTTQHDQEEQQQGDNEQQYQQQQQQQGDDYQDNNQQSHQQQHQQYQQQQQQQQSNHNNQSSSREIVNKRRRFDPRKFRDQMKLGDSIERKLNKIVNKSVITSGGNNDNSNNGQ